MNLTRSLVLTFPNKDHSGSGNQFYLCGLHIPTTELTELQLPGFHRPELQSICEADTAHVSFSYLAAGPDQLNASVSGAWKENLRPRRNKLKTLHSLRLNKTAFQALHFDTTAFLLDFTVNLKTFLQIVSKTRCSTHVANHEAMPLFLHRII